MKFVAPPEGHGTFGIRGKVMNPATKKSQPPIKIVARNHGNANHVTRVKNGLLTSFAVLDLVLNTYKSHLSKLI